MGSTGAVRVCVSVGIFFPQSTGNFPFQVKDSIHCFETVEVQIASLCIVSKFIETDISYSLVFKQLTEKEDQQLENICIGSPT